MANPSLASAHLDDISSELDELTSIAIDLAGSVPQHLVDKILAAVARIEDCAILAGGAMA